VVSLGEVEAPAGVLPGPDDVERVDASPVRVFDPAASEAMVAEVDAAKRGDLRRMQWVVTGEPAQSTNPDDLAQARMNLAFFQRDYRAAAEALAAYGPREFTGGGGFILPREWNEARVALGLGETEKARASFLAARQSAAARAAQRPDDARALMIVAAINAHLGEKDEAIRQGEQALAFDSVAKDALTRSGLMSALANVYTRAGELQRALDMLEQAAKLPGGPSYGNLVLSEVWDPLRKEPRFEKIVASLAPKDRPPAAK